MLSKVGLLDFSLEEIYSMEVIKQMRKVDLLEPISEARRPIGKLYFMGGPRIHHVPRLLGMHQ